MASPIWISAPWYDPPVGAAVLHSSPCAAATVLPHRDLLAQELQGVGALQIEVCHICYRVPVPRPVIGGRRGISRGGRLRVCILPRRRRRLGACGCGLLRDKFPVFHKFRVMLQAPWRSRNCSEVVQKLFISGRFLLQQQVPLREALDSTGPVLMLCPAGVRRRTKWR